MYYEILASLLVLFLILIEKLKKVQSKTIASFLITILIAINIYTKIDLICAIVFVSIDLVTKLILFAYIGDFQKDLSFKKFYVPWKKIISFVILLGIVFVIGLYLKVPTASEKILKPVSLDLVIGLGILLFAILNLKKEKIQ